MTPLEDAVMRFMLAGEGRGLAALREQMATCRVESRRFTEVGFFTDFDVDPQLREHAPVRGGFVISATGAEVAGLKHGGFFALFIRDGVISFLDGSCASENWPDVITTFSLASAQLDVPAELKAP